MTRLMASDAFCVSRSVRNEDGNFVCVASDAQFIFFRAKFISLAAHAFDKPWCSSSTSRAALGYKALFAYMYAHGQRGVPKKPSTKNCANKKTKMKQADAAFNA